MALAASSSIHESNRIDPILHNMSQGNFDEMRINEAHPGGLVKKCDVLGRYVLSCSSEAGSIRLWDMQEGRPCWTFMPNPKIYWVGPLHIVERRVIAAGWVSDAAGSGENRSTICCLNFETGALERMIEHPELDILRVQLVRSRIVGILKKSGILAEWNLAECNLAECDLSGRCTPRPNPKPVDDPYFQDCCSLVASEDFYVKHLRKTLEIYDRKKDRFHLLKVGTKKCRPTSLLISKNRLYCGMEIALGMPQCYVVDLEMAKVVDEYTLTNVFVQRSLYGTKKNSAHSGAQEHISQLLVDEKMLYLGASHGVIGKIPLDSSETGTLLGRHSAQVVHLSFLNEQVLVSASSQGASRLGASEVKFWNRKIGSNNAGDDKIGADKTGADKAGAELTHSEIKVQCLFDLHCHNGSTVTVADSRSVVQYEFNINPQQGTGKKQLISVS